MKYIIEEKLKKLKLLLEHYRKQQKTHKNNYIEDAEKLWNASLFFANIFLSSNYCGQDISEEELKNFISEYETTNKERIDQNGLYSRFWIRKVIGSIHIPHMIRQTARDYDDKKEIFDELVFIRHIKTIIPPISRTVFL